MNTKDSDYEWPDLEKIYCGGNTSGFKLVSEYIQVLGAIMIDLLEEIKKQNKLNNEQ